MYGRGGTYPCSCDCAYFFLQRCLISYSAKARIGIMVAHTLNLFLTLYGNYNKVNVAGDGVKTFEETISEFVRKAKWTCDELSREGVACVVILL